jgi:hypothetical protein
MKGGLLSLVPWLLAGALAVSTFIFHSRWRKAEDDLAAAQDASLKLKQEFTPARNVAVAPPTALADNGEQLRQAQNELARLRNELTHLREQDRDFQQIAKQAEYWQHKARDLVTENSRLKNGSAAVEAADAETQRAACLNNLREIAAAKQKWVEATQVERGSLADLKEIIPYLPNGKLPFCPSGGSYQINRVGGPPVCSYAGHVLKE